MNFIVDGSCLEWTEQDCSRHMVHKIYFGGGVDHKGELMHTSSSSSMLAVSSSLALPATRFASVEGAGVSMMKRVIVQTKERKVMIERSHVILRQKSISAPANVSTFAGTGMCFCLAPHSAHNLSKRKKGTTAELKK
jgi:hypothetical protein